MAYNTALESLGVADQTRIQAKQYYEKQLTVCNKLDNSCEALRLVIEALEQIAIEENTHMP